jgi:toxin YoeB
MSHRLRLTRNAVNDIERHKKSGDKKVLLKISVLLAELTVHPLTGTGQPEKLKHELKGLYSRRINKKHRLVYEVQDDIVLVLSVHAHYRDK